MRTRIPLQESGPTPRRVPRKWEAAYQRLLSLRERLIADRAQLAEHAKVAVGADGIHMADKATDEFERDLELGLLTAKQAALFEIQEALARIESGTYGICELTGKRIPAARLRAIPWTRYTADAEMEIERRGLGARAHLGKLERVEAEPETLSAALDEIETPEEKPEASSIRERIEESPAQAARDENETELRRFQP